MFDRQVQLVDFRFARKNEGRAFTLCGNPEYLAPEVSQKQIASLPTHWSATQDYKVKLEQHTRSFPLMPPAQVSLHGVVMKQNKCLFQQIANRLDYLVHVT